MLPDVVPSQKFRSAPGHSNQADELQIGNKDNSQFSLKFSAGFAATPQRLWYSVRTAN